MPPRTRDMPAITGSLDALGPAYTVDADALEAYWTEVLAGAQTVLAEENADSEAYAAAQATFAEATAAARERVFIACETRKTLNETATAVKKIARNEEFCCDVNMVGIEAILDTAVDEINQSGVLGTPETKVTELLEELAVYAKTIAVITSTPEIAA